ncbi:MAG: family 43 glycosylhydrolase [Lachnospiraceae bacterium]|nr:family 43 glycosylhydrolase [Lachnospiraceae bacterium]
MGNNRLYIKDESANLLTIRDPQIMVVGDTYYLTGTQPPYWEGPNAGVHLWSTKDLEHFTDHGLILKREDMPEHMWCRDRFWAPELFDGKDGWFYLTFNCRNDSKEYYCEHSVGLARAREATGPYEILTKDKPLIAGNDANLFLDDEGALRLACTTGGKLMIFKLDPESVSLSDGITVCTVGKEGEWDSIGVEGQFVLKRCGRWFQWYSSWTTGYHAGILTADCVDGPWTKYENNPVLTDSADWDRAGHNHGFTGPDGRDYITFHANLKEPDGEDVERFFIRPVVYKEDGTVEIW